ncbi:MAG: hypothetical protein KDI37_16395 [Xanthomonadales bacterium]|nr:hypothetical protein [Xanthomonadales bacterium]
MAAPSPHVIALIGPNPPRTMRPWLRREHGLRWWPRQDAEDEPAFETIESVNGEASLAEQPCRFQARYGERWIELIIEYEGRWRFLLDAGGRSIRLLDGDWPPATVVLGPPLLLALAHAGRFCLHASAIAGANAQAWLFSAASGTGKSTLAAAATTIGWQRLCDDLAPLWLSGADVMPWLLPRIPQLKLGASAAAPPPAVRCAALVQLARGSETDWSVLPDAQRLPLLLGGTVASRLFDQRLAARHLDWASRLASRQGGLALWRLTLAESQADPVSVALDALRALPEATLCDVG